MTMHEIALRRTVIRCTASPSQLHMNQGKRGRDAYQAYAAARNLLLIDAGSDFAAAFGVRGLEVRKMKMSIAA